MTELSCHCGQVALRIATTPAFIHACNCSLCRKSGAQWAYLAPDEVAITGPTTGYVRADKPGAGAEIRFCPVCGSTTHFVLTPSTIALHGNTMVGVNMALADEAALTGVEMRFPDGAAWAGEGPFGYLRESVIIGSGDQPHSP
ncbi:GFA family protein [Novosphingobium jiangmenense]|uniref:GFA family protein n=1 Tax=Novosphingobium jiangmenense TaxID=2791981 RepID=A0ABS0HBI7_9SPHN|nr:GFA family protein [Novosphingobium jiangmenense]MBF9149375.1 GFA family protein [Novosphingobium jiangmenense]